MRSRSGYTGAIPRVSKRSDREPARYIRGRVAADPLASFTPQVRDWFDALVRSPTAAQEKAWPAIAAGENVLLSAPTGSGKTLAAFLWGLDRLWPSRAEGERRTRLVYVSPLKALSYDVEKNLRAPLTGIGGDVSVASAPATRRSASARRCCATRPTCSSPRRSRST